MSEEIMLKCKICGKLLIFRGGVKQGRSDLELYKCNNCNKVYSHERQKNKLEEYIFKK